MKSIFFRALGIFAFMVAMIAANAKEPVRISRSDCHATFLVPNGLEYVEVNGIPTAGDDQCYIAFNYTGDLKIKSRKNPPSTAEEWRWSTDLALTIKGVPLAENLAKIDSDDGARQHGLFNLASKEHFLVPGGEMYILRYSAVKPTRDMLRLNEAEETIFTAGNNFRSVSYIQYTGAKPSKKDKKKTALYRSLFSSFGFEN
jgi:hypothetical protein